MKIWACPFLWYPWCWRTCHGPYADRILFYKTQIMKELSKSGDSIFDIIYMTSLFFILIIKILSFVSGDYMTIAGN